jgi:quercetin dioxygenase-like cupin family protein
MVSPPLLPPRDAASLTNYVVPLRLPLKPDPESGWKPYHCFKGSSEVFDNFSCHVSALSQDKCPHPPHTHQEEELLIVLDGEVDLLLPDLSHDDDQQTIRLKRGELVYYPINFAHTLKTVSTEPANYLMLRWCCDAEPIDDAVELPFGRFDLPESFDNLDAQQGFRTHLIFEGPTAHLGKLHCHISTLGPGASYEPHIDPYDVAIIVLEGELETLGQTLMSCGVIYYPAGEPHGMSNPGQEMAKYVVFEFHGRLKTAPDEYEHLHREFHQLLDNYTHLQEHYQRLEVDYQNLRQACSLGKLARLTRWLRRVFSPAQSAQ